MLGIGYKKALSHIKEYRKIEEIVMSLDAKKYTTPEAWNYPEARELFLAPEVTPGVAVDFKWGDADEAGMVDFLVGEKSFNEERVRNVYKRIVKSKGIHSNQLILARFACSRYASCEHFV